MNTTFFKQINDLLMVSETLNITIRKNSDNELCVSVNPLKKVKDNAKDYLQPILFTGTVDEFDAQFFQLLKTPLENSNNLLRNMHQHEKAVEKAKEESEIAKAEKEKQKKIREKSIKQLEKAQKYFDEKEYDKCKFICNQILKDDAKFSKATQLVKECDEQNVQPDMFSQASIDAPKEPVVEETQPLPNVPVAEPCESIVTPVSESTYPDGTPKFQKEMENVDEEMRIQDKNQDLPDSYDNEHLAVGPKPPIQENNSVGSDIAYQPVSDAQEEMIRQERDDRFNSSQSTFVY